MRILVITNRYPPQSIGGYELQCFQIVHELGKRGHRLTVLTSKPEVETHTRFSETRVARELLPYSDETESEPGFHRLYKTVRYNRAVLGRHLLGSRPDVIMIWDMHRLPTSLLQMAEESGIPCLYAVYDRWLADSCENEGWCRYWNSDETYPRPALTLLRGLRLDKFVQKQAPPGDLRSLRLRNIYFSSESLKAQTQEACRLPLDHALVIPIAVAARDIRPKQGQATHTFRILFAASLSEEKDPMTALRSIQELRHRGDERFTLDIYGRGRPEYEASLHDYVRRFHLGGTVSFKPVPEEQVHNSLHLYDAAVFTSRASEPFPHIHIKAMAARVPVISTLDGACAELIRHGENGLAVETGNHYQLADRLAQIADEPELVRSLVRNALADITQNYSLSRVTSRIESLLHWAVRSEGPVEKAV